MPNLYRETAEPALTTPPLHGELRADVVVVGGGITGLSAALHLAQSGREVVLLEAHEPGWGASGRNGGQVNPGLKFDPDVVERDFGAAQGGRMNALSGGAPTFVFELIARLGIACDARRNGTLRAAVSANQSKALTATVEQWRRRDAPVELVTGSALYAATGTDRYERAMLDRRGGDLNPLSYARGLARAASSAGARVHGGSRALRLEQTGDLWTVHTAAGKAIAPSVVLGTNGYTDDLWPGLRRSVVPVFGAMTATVPLPQALALSIMPSRSVLYEMGAITVYYRVDSGGRLLLGGRGPQREIESIAAVPYLPAYAERLWPALRDVAFTHAWGGQLGMTRDHYPHVHEPAPGIIACLGYNGRGVAMATVMGAMIARRIREPRAPFDMPITGVQPIRLHSAWPVAVRAAIAKGRVTDWLGL
jgi:glycine/D-amino acid oxidase-like deaminating enzyme